MVLVTQQFCAIIPPDLGEKQMETILFFFMKIYQNGLKPDGRPEEQSFIHIPYDNYKLPEVFSFGLIWF